MTQSGVVSSANLYSVNNWQEGDAEKFRLANPGRIMGKKRKRLCVTAEPKSREERPSGRGKARLSMQDTRIAAWWIRARKNFSRIHGTQRVAADYISTLASGTGAVVHISVVCRKSIEAHDQGVHRFGFTRGSPICRIRKIILQHQSFTMPNAQSATLRLGIMPAMRARPVSLYGLTISTPMPGGLGGWIPIQQPGVCM